MYYEPGKTPHGVAYDPFKSCVVPRPMGWISTSNGAGVDSPAPFSQFQNVNFDPPGEAALGAHGRINVPGLRPLARLDYHDYTSLESRFSMRPEGGSTGLAGREGSPEGVTAALTRSLPEP